MTPAYAGVISHLLHVASETPVLTEFFGGRITISRLGDVDMETPLASMVVSEAVNVSRFIPSLLNNGFSCVLSFSGCDNGVLKSACLMDSSVAVLSLPHIWNLSRSGEAQRFSNFANFAKAHSITPESVGEIFDSSYRSNCQQVDETAFFIADCIVVFTKLIAQTSLVDRDLFL